jgi:hypothetical protein
MRPTDYFLPILTSSTLKKPLLEIAHTAKEWHRYYNFDVTPIPPAVLGQDPVLLFLMSRYNFIGGITRMPANTCYNWHTDTDRRVGLNMLLEDGGDSRCLFTNSVEDVVFPFLELDYLPKTYYAFNTQAPHSVYNFTKPRYLFTLEFFDKDRELTFADLCSVIRACSL